MKNNINHIVSNIIKDVTGILADSINENMDAFAQANLSTTQVISTLIAAITYNLLSCSPDFDRGLLERWILATSEILLAYEAKASGKEIPESIFTIP